MNYFASVYTFFSQDELNKLYGLNQQKFIYLFFGTVDEHGIKVATEPQASESYREESTPMP